MCLSCACGKPNEKHGDDRNITLQDVQAAAQAADVRPEEAAKNIQEGFQQFGQRETANVGAQSATGDTQATGNNQQNDEQRQGGYGSGGSSGPQ